MTDCRPPAVADEGSVNSFEANPPVYKQVISFGVRHGGVFMRNQNSALPTNPNKSSN